VLDGLLRPQEEEAVVLSAIEREVQLAVLDLQVKASSHVLYFELISELWDSCVKTFRWLNFPKCLHVIVAVSNVHVDLVLLL
jgi:hypothetical protein